VMLAYHKFDEQGNTQVYCARLINDGWQIKKITDWDYRWYFRGPGCVLNDVIIAEVEPRYDGYMNLDYEHIKYGIGTWLLNDELEIVGSFKKQLVPPELTTVESKFPEMIKQMQWDVNGKESDSVRYVLTWETLPRNRDLPREGKLPQPSVLKLCEIKCKKF
jgi:hypothetical protein